MAEYKSRVLWTKKEDAVLFEYYYDSPMNEISERLPGRSNASIWHRAENLGLKRKNRYGSLELEGKRFGLLVVLCRTDERAGEGSFYWMCQCDCGNVHKASTNNLSRGQVQSCGCTHRVRSTDAGIRAFIRNYKTHAKNRGFEWSLSYEFVSRVVRMDCAYCGMRPEQKLISASKGIPLIYNGIDRIDSTLGYTEDNCVACCKICNWCKGSMPVEEWISHLRKIVEHIDSPKFVDRVSTASRIDKANPRVEITLTEVE